MKRTSVKPAMESPAKGPLVITPRSREEWLKYRMDGIGGSEIAAVLGISPWETPYRLWLRKRGLAPETPETPAMRAGRLLEAAVARFWTEETGIATVPGSEADHIYADPARPYLRATPDRIYLVEDGGGIADSDCRTADGGTPGGRSPFPIQEIGVLECKTTRKKVDPEDLPPHWFCQLQWQMGIAGAKAGQIAWLTAGTDFGRAEVAFVPQFYAWMAGRAERFWTDCVIGGREPEPTDGADAAAMFPRHVEGMLIGADEKAYGTYAELVALKGRLSEMEAQKSELEGRLKLAIGQAEGLHWHGRTIATWKAARDGEAFDAKAFRREHPELAAKYTMAKPGARRFLLK